MINKEQEEGRFHRVPLNERKPVKYSIFRMGRATPLFHSLSSIEAMEKMQEIKEGKYPEIPKHGTYYTYKERNWKGGRR